MGIGGDRNWMRGFGYVAGSRFWKMGTPSLSVTGAERVNPRKLSASSLLSSTHLISFFNPLQSSIDPPSIDYSNLAQLKAFLLENGSHSTFLLEPLLTRKDEA